MAKDVKANPWFFDAAAQGEGFGPNEDAVSVVFTVKPYISLLRIKGGAGGSVVIHSRQNVSVGNNDRYVILNETLGAGESKDFPVNQRVDGLFLTTFPIDAELFAFHGYEASGL